MVHIKGLLQGTHRKKRITTGDGDTYIRIPTGDTFKRIITGERGEVTSSTSLITRFPS